MAKVDGTHIKISIHALREEGDRSRCHYLTGLGAISIHALREEGDQSCTLNLPCHENFYPRPPRGGRPFTVQTFQQAQHISIHALREEGDSFGANWAFYELISIHALREEGDL